MNIFLQAHGAVVRLVNHLGAASRSHEEAIFLILMDRRKQREAETESPSLVGALHIYAGRPGAFRQQRRIACKGNCWLVGVDDCVTSAAGELSGLE
jgi:hypothetical protein